MAWLRELTWVSLVVGLVAAPLGAQERDPAGAQKLYDDALVLLEKGDFTNACPKFEQSQKLDPSAGTLLSLAGCAEHYGKLATAWSHLKAARALTPDVPSAKRRADMEVFIDAGIARLQPRIPMLTINVFCADQAAPGGRRPCNDAPGLKVVRSGQDVSGGVGNELPVDPGPTTLEASATGFKDAKTSFDLKEGVKETREIVLEPKPEDPKIIDDPKITPPPPPPPPKEPPPTLTGLQIGGIILGGVGLVTVAVSIGTGVVAQGMSDELAELCPGGDGETVECSSENFDRGTELSEEGPGYALASTVTTFVGGALLGAGIAVIVAGSVMRNQEVASVVVVPVVAGDFVGLSTIGTF
jgi:hypothetical protein